VFVSNVGFGPVDREQEDVIVEIVCLRSLRAAQGRASHAHAREQVTGTRIGQEAGRRVSEWWLE
jgi:hypothetical protein